MRIPLHQKLYASILSVILPNLCLAQDPTACDDPALPGFGQPAEHLRAIAASCSQVELSDLYYNRAYFEELHDSLVSLSRISLQGSGSGGMSPDAFRIYIALTELMAEKRIRDPLQRARILNRSYDEVLEVTELRLKGFDLTANRLEQRFGW